MVNGFVFVLLFTGFCSCTEIKIASVETPLTSNNNSTSAVNLQKNTRELTAQPKYNSSQIVQRTLELVLTTMNKNMEKQAQTSYLLNLLLNILKKNVDSFNEKEIEIMNNILNTVDASKGPIIEPENGVLRLKSLEMKKKSPNNKSFCAQALLKIMEVVQKAYLQLFDAPDPEDLNQNESITESDSVTFPYKLQQLENNISTIFVPKDDGQQQAKPTIDKFIIVKPVDDHASEPHTPIHIDGSSESKKYLTIYDDPYEKFGWNYFFGPKNNISTTGWQTSEKEISIPVPDLNLSNILSPSSSNYYPWVPGQENHRIEHSNIYLPSYDNNHKPYNNIGKYSILLYRQLRPKDYNQSPNLEVTTKRSFVSENIFGNPIIEIKPTYKQNKLPKYLKSYLDTESASKKPINENHNYIQYIPENLNLNPSDNLDMVVGFNTKSPMPYDIVGENTSFDWHANHNPWNDDYSDEKNIITKDENNHPSQGPWIGNHNFWYNENHYINPQGHLSLVYMTPNHYVNYKHHGNDKPSIHNTEDLGPIDGHSAVMNYHNSWNNKFKYNDNNNWDGNPDWFDKHFLKVELTTKLPVSIDELTNPNHYNYWENPFFNSYVNLESATIATPTIINGKINDNVWHGLDNYGSVKNTNNPKMQYGDHGMMKIPINYNSVKKYFSHFQTSNMMPNGIRDQIKENTNADHPVPIYTHGSENHNVPNNYLVENIVNQVIPLNPTSNYMNQWNQPKYAITFNEMLNLNNNNEIYSNKYPTYPQNQVNKIEPNIIDPFNNYHFNQETEVPTEGKILNGESLGDDKNKTNNPWNPYSSNYHNAYIQTIYSNFPPYFDFSTRKDVIDSTTPSPNTSWKGENNQKPYNFEGDYQSSVNHIITTRNPITDSLEYIIKKTNSDTSPSNNEQPWLDIEFTPKYSVIVNNAPEHVFPGHDNLYPWGHDQHSTNDAESLDWSDMNYEGGETYTSSHTTENQNTLVNSPFDSFYTDSKILTNHESFQIPKDVQESEESTHTDAIKNLDLNHTRLEGNSAELNTTEGNIINDHNLEPEPEVIKLIEDTIKNIQKNVDAKTDLKTLESIDQLKRMINEANISNSIYLQILRTFHGIKENFEPNKYVDKVITLQYLNSLVNMNNPQMSENNVVEISYLIKSPTPVVINPYYYVKYHVPLTQLDQWLSQNSYMSNHDEKLHVMLLKLSKISDLSSALKKVSKGDIDKLTVRHGSLVKTNLIDSEGTEIPLRKSIDDMSKINHTEDTRQNIGGSEDYNIKELRIKVNDKPYHTITTINDDVRSTPIIEDPPSIDNLNDLNNPFRKIFPMHKLIKATEKASDLKKYDRSLLSLPFGREETNKAKEYSYDKNYDNTKDNPSGQTLPYISTINDPNAFIVNTRVRNYGEFVPPMRRADSDQNRPETSL